MWDRAAARAHAALRRAPHRPPRPRRLAVRRSRRSRDVRAPAARAARRARADRSAARSAAFRSAARSGMWLALDAPERIDRLVLAARRRASGRRSSGTSAHRARREPRGWRRSPSRCCERWFTPAFRDAATLPRRCFVATPPEGYARCCEASARLGCARRAPRVSGADDSCDRRVSTIRSAPPDAARSDRGARFPALALVVHRRRRDTSSNVERADAFNEALVAHLAA